MKKIAAALMVGGCSWALMETVPEKQDLRHEPRCTGTKGFAALDALLAVGDGVAIAVGASLTTDDGNGGTKVSNAGGTMIGIAAVEGLLHVVSIFSGIKNAEACVEARAARDHYVDTHAMAASPHDAGVDAFIVDAMPIDAAPDAKLYARPPDTEEPPHR